MSRRLGVQVWGVCRDRMGTVVWCVTDFATEVRDSLMVEAMAMLWAMVITKSMGARRLVMESDNLSVIQALKGRATGASTFHLIIEDI